MLSLLSITVKKKPEYNFSLSFSNNLVPLLAFSFHMKIRIPPLQADILVNVK